MTVWDHLVANSTLAEEDGDAWEHLTNPSGEGGGLIINSDVVFIAEDKVIEIKEDNNIIEIKEQKPIFIEELDIIDEIIEDEGDVIDVIC